MKKYSFKKFLEYKNEEKKKNRSLILGLIFLSFIAVIILIALYIGNSDFRSFVDVYILRKEVYENNAATLTIDSNDMSLVYAFNNHILTLDNGDLNFYDSSAKLSNTLNITLSNPIASSDGKYLVLGDLGLQKLYLIQNNNIEWQKEVEGNISKVNVNKNGYVSVIVSDSTYESIVILYDNSGNELFKMFLSSTYAIDSDVSDKNEYLAIAQVDYSGINIKSKVEIISVESAINDKENAKINTYNADIGEMILDINYQNNNELYCQLDNSIISITPSDSEEVFEIDDSTIFLSDATANSFVRIDKESSGILNSDYRMKITDLKGNEHVYVIEGSVKNMKTSNKIVAINHGKQVNFVNLNGWLKKKYISTREIKDVMISDNIAAIIYKNKIDIIKL